MNRALAGVVLSSLLVAYGSAALWHQGRLTSDHRAEGVVCAVLLCREGAGLRENPLSPRRWCALGESLLDSGERDKARYCIRRAVELGPNSPPILTRAANFHFRIDESRQAMHYMARILRMVDVYDGTIFSSYLRMGGEISEVLEHGIPEDRRAAQSFFRYLLRQGAMPELEATWKWIVARSRTDDPLAGEYVQFLLRHRRYDAAAQTWTEHLGERKGDYLEGNHLFNGDFEWEPTGAILDWVVRPVDGALARREWGTPTSGQWSLRIDFAGK